jgi:hypothetical protein
MHTVLFEFTLRLNVICPQLVSQSLKPKHLKILFKHSGRTSNRTPRFSITRIRWLMLFKEIISVYIENHKELTNTKYGFTWVCIEYVCFILRAILVSYKKKLKNY